MPRHTWVVIIIATFVLGAWGDCTSDAKLYDLTKAMLVNGTEAFPNGAMMLLLSSGIGTGDYSSCEAFDNAHWCRFSFPTALSSVQAGICIPKSCKVLEAEHHLPELLFGTAAILYGTTRTGNGTLYCPDERASFTNSAGAVTMVVISCLLLGLTLIATAWDVLRETKCSCSAEEEVDVGLDYVPLEKDRTFEGAAMHRMGTLNSASKRSPSNPFDEGASSAVSGVQRPSKPKAPLCHRLLQAWSIKQNLPKLFALPPNDVVDLNALNGIRVFSMGWIILGHTLQFSYLAGVVPVNNPLYLESITKRFSFSVQTQALLAVDTFFLLSGLLGTYLLLKEVRKTQRVRAGLFVLHRFLRLTPVMAYWLFFYFYMLWYIGNGPNFPKYKQAPLCDKYWWTNLLYINNFHPPHLNDECFSWGWYLANDMQLSLLVPLLVYVYYKKPQWGWFLLFTLVGASISIGAVLSAKYHFTARGVFGSDWLDYIRYYYTKPYTRASPYLVGIGLAWILDAYVQRRKEEKDRAPYLLTSPSRRPAPWMLWLGALASATALGVTVFGSWDLVHNPKPHDWPRWLHVFWVANQRFIWALGLAYMIWAMALRYGGWLRVFLAHPFWVPLVRLTYQAYLVQIIVMYAVGFNVYDDNTYSDINYVYQWLGNCAGSYLVAFVGWLCLEKPLLNLEMMALKG